VDVHSLREHQGRQRRFDFKPASDYTDFIMKLNSTFLPRFFWLAALIISTSGLRAEEHATFPVGEFIFTRPVKWEWVESTSKMRKAQLKVTDAASKASADVAFYYFGTNGAGGVQANVDRWLGQFAEPKDQINAKVEHTTVGKTKLTYVQAEGTYNSGMPGGAVTPMPDYALVGAILESDQGNVYVRMTGPKAFVRSAVVDFKKMIEDGPKKD
jgi:hypothetical protein